MYRALTSFTGIVSMAVGEVGEIADKAVAMDLLNAGYIEEITPAEAPAVEVTKPKKKRTPKGE